MEVIMFLLRLTVSSKSCGCDKVNLTQFFFCSLQLLSVFIRHQSLSMYGASKAFDERHGHSY